MTTLQRIIKYLAIAFAIFLALSILGAILGVAGLFGGIFSGEAVLEEAKTYSVDSDIRDLDIEINAADLLIKEGDAFRVESNLKHLKVEEKDGLLSIRETKKYGGTYNGAQLTVYVPAGTVFDKVSLTTGAGRLTAAVLAAHTLDFELGAGDVSIGALIATGSADIEGGAGRITVSDGAIEDLDLEMGVGQLNLTARLSGECQLDLGVGESNITLIGSKDDYKLDLEKGIGSITVDGKSPAEYGSGNGANEVEINGGVGAIRVQFLEILDTAD